MAFRISTRNAQAGARSGLVYELMDDAETMRAEVWPMVGFNCLRWQLRLADGSWGNIFYVAEDWETNPVPTRNGHPILFPFPGRLRNGRFSYLGRDYQLPLNDSTRCHAIHGFTPRDPWRVVKCVEEEAFAQVVGEFRLEEDLPKAVGLWPSSFLLRVRYSLLKDRLRVETEVENVGQEPMPFGLGYHPYFRVPGVVGDVASHMLQAHVSEIWETTPDNLPTGRRLAVPPELDFSAPRAIGPCSLDHVFTGVTSQPPPGQFLRELAKLSHPTSTIELHILADAAFRELVLFTPPHKQAIAIEPYTCSADAANLQAQGVDSGWQELLPGRKWAATVQYLALRR